MSASGSEIQLRTFPRVSAGRAVAVGATLAVTLATGLVIGRATAPSSESGRTSVSAPAISTRWLADADAVQLRVMEHMNGIASETPFLATDAVQLRVMEHMNRLLASETP
jgi:hypothetical protein